MDLILANADGQQVKVIRYPVFDCDCNGNNKDFSLSIPVSEWDGSIAHGMRLFVPGEEYGGVIGQISTDTSIDTITVSGHTWRGMLADKIISPPDGTDYLTVSGDMQDIVRQLIGDRFSRMIVAETGASGIMVPSYQFKRYCTMLEGLNDLTKEYGARLDLRYDEMTDRMIIKAVQAHDYSHEIELSQDYDMQFTYDDVRNQPNHMIAGGKGELHERQILHLYADEDGTISTTQTFFGADEIEYFYDNTSSEEPEKDARKKFEELLKKSELQMSIDRIPDDARIGDVVGGRDYITGLSMKAPIGNIVLKINGDMITKDYKLEAEK